MKKFEYKLVHQDDINCESVLTIQAAFNRIGELGWELCSIDWGCLIFKREIP